MFTTIKTGILASLAVILLTGNAIAQSTPGVDQRQKNQAKRIFNGIQDGSLTARETRQLVRGQRRINAKEQRFKSDGVVTKSERARLHRAQNRQSRRIYRKKHN